MISRASGNPVKAGLYWSTSIMQVVLLTGTANSGPRMYAGWDAPMKVKYLFIFNV